jgi:hypothetical protein
MSVKTALFISQFSKLPVINPAWFPVFNARPGMGFDACNGYLLWGMLC